VFKKPYLPTFAALLLVGACGQKANEPAAEPPAAEPAAAASAPAALARTPAPEGARVYFITPADGDVVTSPVLIEFGIEAMAVVPAGQMAPSSGHHHVIIDADLPPMNLPVPADANHVHFGDGRTRTELALEPGQHTLQLVFADHLHIPHDPPVVSERITITVE
jgi:hypothetical protein